MSTLLQTKKNGKLYGRLGSKATGKSHVLNNLGCQDAFSAWPMTSVPSPTCVMAVGDGHGSPQYGRSDVGSFIAVEAATEVLGFYAKRLGNKPVSTRLRDLWSDKIPKLIYEKWYRRVLRHFDSQPFQASDFYGLSEKVRIELTTNPVTAYGTTLLTATITPTFLALVRIGDGVFVVCDDNGELNLPFGEEDEVDESTASLCLPNALNLFEVEFIPLEDAAPSMVLLSTDGYYKDCGKIRDFLPLVTSLYECATTHTMVELSETIEASLTHRAQTAPDDLTFGLLVRSDIVEGGS